MKRWIKFSIGAGILLLAILMLAPSIAKWYIEKNSVEWTGRKITMTDLRLNYFTGAITIEGLRVLEAGTNDTFFEASRIYANTEPWKAMTSFYEVIDFTIDKPYVLIKQTGDKFNFDDLVERFSASDTTSTAPAGEPVHYALRKFSITNGIMVYTNQGIGNTVKALNLNTTLSLLAWNDPNQHYTLDLGINQGGLVHAIFDLNTTTLDYKLQYDMRDLSLDVLYPYLKDYIRVDELKGQINTGLKIYGNFNEPEAIAATGDASLVNLSITDPNKEPLVSIGSFAVDIDTLNVKSDIYNLRRISIQKPFLKFELFENQNNFSKLLDYSTDTNGDPDTTAVAVETGNIFEIVASYVHELSENYAVSNYRADSVSVSGGTLIFNDYTLDSKFNYFLEDLAVKAERLNSANQRLTFLLSSKLNNSGNMKGKLLVDPNGFRDMEIVYAVDDLKMTDFNPYSDYYVAHPFLDGVCFYTTESTIKNRFLTSKNKLEIRKIIVGKRIKNKTAVKLPLRFAVALLRDVNGNVNLDVPVTGNLDDPKYRLGPIIWQILKNLILKAVAAPGKLLAKRSGVDEKYLEGFDWKLLQESLDEEQLKALDAAAKTLEVSPEMNLELVKSYNINRELDQLALEQSKRRFLFFSRKISSEENVSPDEEKLVQSVEAKDSLFNAYVDAELKSGGSLQSIFDKSRRLVGAEKLKTRLLSLYEARTESIRKYLAETKGLEPSRFRIIEPKEIKEMAYETPSRSEMRFALGDEEASEPDEGEKQ